MSEFSQLLLAAGAGNCQAVANLFTIVYEELKQLATHRLGQERPGQTLQPTALVHEVYLRLFATARAVSGEDMLPLKSRQHFFAAAAEAMRRILIESARRKNRVKRGGGWVREVLDPDQLAAPEIADNLLALDEALTAFAVVQPAMAEVVNLRYFAGLTAREAAATLGISLRTANAYWAYARAWLLAEMERTDNRHQPPLRPDL